MINYPDYQIRSWALDNAINKNKKGTSTETIIKDAEAFYGFLFPENGKVKEIIYSNKNNDLIK